MAATQRSRSRSSRSGTPRSRRARAIDRMADELRNMGVSNSQLRDMAERRELVHDIRVESPVDGVVLKRNVSPGLRFDRGFEFYRIADLNRVWILADVYRHQLPFIRRGASARITTPEDSRARVGDGESVRADLRRGDADAEGAARGVEPAAGAQARACSSTWSFRSIFPATLVVPADAIVDSGLRKTVFVDRGDGHFEPRLVETGWRMGDDVEVTKGLMPGERIVISGTFFIDSESRMKSRRSGSHDRAHHRHLGQEQVPGPAAGWRRRGRRGARAAQRAARRDSGSRRHAGHRLLAVGSQPRPHRGAGHVSDRDGDAWRAARESGSRRLRFRLLVRLRHLRRRHRHLLGAHANARVPVRRAVAAAARFADRARAGRDRSSAGCSSTRSWTTRANTAWRICGRIRTGTCATTSRRCPACRRWLRSAASAGSIR